MKDNLKNICITALIVLWTYAAMSKLIDYSRFVLELELHIFGTPLGRVIAVSVPAIEIIACLLLISPNGKRYGLYLSALLLFMFTCYIGYFLSGYATETPCGCGGILQSMGWRAHFVFNLLMLSASLLAIYLTKGKEATGTEK